jgi:hypothetical protein
MIAMMSPAMRSRMRSLAHLYLGSHDNGGKTLTGREINRDFRAIKKDQISQASCWFPTEGSKRVFTVPDIVPFVLIVYMVSR